MDYYSKKKLFFWFTLSVLISLTYFASILTCCVLIGILVLFILHEQFNSNSGEKLLSKKLLNLYILLLTSSLPTLVMAILFLRQINFPPTNDQYSIITLLKWIVHLRSIIVYDYLQEMVVTQYIFIILIILFLLALYHRIINYKNSFKVELIDVFLISSFIIFLSLFIVKNGSTAGMMTDRLCLLFFILFIIWIAGSPSFRNIFNYLLLGLFFSSYLFLLQKHRIHVIKQLDLHAQIIVDAAKYIKPKGIVYPIQVSNNWIEIHFSNYLGIDMPLVILDNYKAGTGWFPVKWNSAKHTEIDKFIKQDSIDSLCNLPFPFYVLIYGCNANTLHSNSKNVSKIKFKFKHVYTSSDNYLSIYKL